MKKKIGGKSQTGTMTSEEINKSLGGDIAGATKKVYDQYPKGSTFVKKEDGRRNVPIIENKKSDSYKGISKKSKLEGGVDNTTNFDRAAYKKMVEEE